MSRSPIETAADLSRPDETAGLSSTELWRHVVLQALDIYESRRRRGLAAELFLRESTPVDADDRARAGLASLAEHLAERDGWLAPPWVVDVVPLKEPWYVSDLPGVRRRARSESPPAFARRHIFVTAAGLERV